MFRGQKISRNSRFKKIREINFSEKLIFHRGCGQMLYSLQLF